MRITSTRKQFNPYARIEEARAILASSNDLTPSDIWVAKLVGMLEVRQVFQNAYLGDYMTAFAKQFPLYCELLSAFEDTRSGGDRDLLEACIIASPDCMEVADSVGGGRFSPEFVQLYRQLFFDITHTMGSKATLFQYIIVPLLKSNSSKLPIGVIWKILALTGGLPLLIRKGLGTDAIRVEDVEYLMQLTSMRHLGTMLQYASDGVAFFEDNPAAAVTLNMLADFDGLRGAGRRSDYMAKLLDVSKNSFSQVLSSELKLISAPAELLNRLSEVDGNFAPDLADAFEQVKHITYIEDESKDD